MRYTFILLLLILLSINSFSQERIVFEGYIVDESEMPISRANIIVHAINKNDTSLYFAISNSAGFFQIGLKPQTTKIYVSVSCIGKKDTTLKFSKYLIGDESVKIILEDNYVEIPSIEITSPRLPYVASNDTVSFDVQSYLKPRDTNIEDLLKKMPGFVVQTNGDIFFKGKKISRILINSMDIFNKNTKIASRNIGAELIDTLQVVENYHENSVLKLFDEEKESIINLKFKKHLSSTFAKFQPGVGVKSKVNSQINIYKLCSSSGNVFLANHNNIGYTIDKFGVADNNQDQKIPFGNSSPLFSKKVIRPINLKGLEVFNKLFLLNYNFNHNLKKGKNIRAKIIGAKDYIFSDNIQYNEYTFSKNPFSYTLRQNNSSKEKRGAFDFSYSDQSMPGRSFMAFLKVSHTDIQSTFSEKVLSDSVNRRVEGFYNDKSTEFLISTEYSHQLKKKIALVINTEIINKRIPQYVDFSTTTFNKSEVEEENVHNIQNSGKLLQSFIIRSDLLIKQDGVKHFAKVSGGYYFGSQSLDVEFNNNYIFQDEMEDGIINELRFSRFFFGVKYRYTLNNIKFSIDLKPIIQSTVSKNIPGSFKTNIFLEPTLAFMISKPVHNLLISFNKNKTILPVENFFQGVFLKSPRHYQEGCDFFLSDSQSLLLNYNYSNLFHNTNIGLNILYNRQSPTLGSRIIIEKENKRFQRTLVEDQKSYFANILGEKYFSQLYSKVGLAYIFSNIESNDISLNGLLMNQYFVSHRYRLFLNTVFDFPINVNFNIDYSRNLITQKNTNLFNSFSKVLNSRLELYINFNEEIYAGLITNSWNHFTNNNLFFSVDFINKIKILNNKLTLECIIRNLLNENTFQQVSISEFSKSVNQISIQPRQFLLRLSFYIPTL